MYFNTKAKERSLKKKAFRKRKIINDKILSSIARVG